MHPSSRTVEELENGLDAFSSLSSLIGVDIDLEESCVAVNELKQRSAVCSIALNEKYPKTREVARLE